MAGSSPADDWASCKMGDMRTEGHCCVQVSLVMVVVGAVVFAYRRYAGLDKPLTIVTKQGDV